MHSKARLVAAGSAVAALALAGCSAGQANDGGGDSADPIRYAVEQPDSMIPGNQFSSYVILETIFALPGLGTLLVNGINSRDYPVVQGVIFVYGVLFVLTNLVTDLSYRRIDPRVRF